MKYYFSFLFLIISNFGIAQWGPPGGGGGGGRDGGGSERQRPSAQTQTPNLEGNAPKGNSKISGLIVNQEGTAAVEYANVALYLKSTKKPVDGAMADEKGAFTLKKVAPGEYYLQVTFIGYETKIVEGIIVEKSKDISIGTIKVSTKANELNEVTVTGQSALIEEKVDRLVYNAEKDLTTKGGDASDVLKNVPMLNVDLDGNVSLRGNSNLRVLINNKPSTIVASSVADALKMIPADLIKTVEVITSPSAKYDAEGSGGIINIITRKSSLQGLNLNLDTGIGIRSSNMGLNGNFRKGKLGISLGGFGRALYNPSSSTSEQTIKTVDLKTIQTQEGKHLGVFGRYNVGFDYDLTKNQSLSGGIAFGTRRFNRDMSLNSQSFLATVPTVSTIRNVNSNDNSDNIDMNLDYLRTFKPGQEWSISTQYSTNNLVNNFNSDLMNTGNEILSRQKNINKNTNTEITLQTDYVHPFKNKMQLEIGAKNVIRKVNSDFEYQIASPNGTFANDARNPMGFLLYDQNIIAAYSSFLFATKNKVNFKLGLRYEFTDIGGKDQKSVIDIPAYSNLVPSINISKSVRTNTYKFAYNRRIQRPGLQQLNPNVNLSNPLNISYGNRDLNPELTDNFEISLGKSIQKSYLSVAVFARQSANSITRISSPSLTTAGAIETTFENIGLEQSLGSNIFGNVFFNSKWTLNGGVDVYYKYLEGRQVNLQNVSELVSNSGIVVSGRINTNFKLKNDWAFQAQGGIHGRQINLQGYQGGMGRYSVGIRKDVGKKHSFGLGADNFASIMKMRNFTDSPTLVQKSTNYMYNSNVKFTFTYKLGNMRFVEQKKGKKVKNDDVKEGSTDN
jgi:ferric enterobactin receptor